MTALLGGGRIVAAAVSMLWMTVVARHLPAGEVGSLSLGLTLFAALSVLADLGLPMVVADRVARRPVEARSLVTAVVKVRLVAAVAVGLVIAVLYRLGSDDTLVVPVAMGVGLVGNAVHSTVTAALRGTGQVFPDAANEVVSRLFVLAVGTALLVRGGGLAAAAGVFALADVGSAVVLARWARRVTPDADIAVQRSLFAFAALAPMALALLVASLHTRVDVWLLAVVGGTEAAAHYAVPARVAEGLLLPAAVGASLVLPFTSGAVNLRQRGRRALAYVGAVVGVVGVCAVVVAIAAEPLLRLGFGEPYADDSDVLVVLAAAAVPAAVGVGLTPLLAIHARRALVGCVSVALAANVGLNLLLLPGHAELGAAWASLASTMLLALGAVTTIVRWTDAPVERIS